MKWRKFRIALKHLLSRNNLIAIVGSVIKVDVPSDTVYFVIIASCMLCNVHVTHPGIYYLSQRSEYSPWQFSRVTFYILDWDASLQITWSCKSWWLCSSSLYSQKSNTRQPLLQPLTLWHTTKLQCCTLIIKGEKTEEMLPPACSKLMTSSEPRQSYLITGGRGEWGNASFCLQQTDDDITFLSIIGGAFLKVAVYCN